jgi:O-antigen ligase
MRTATIALVCGALVAAWRAIGAGRESRLVLRRTRTAITLAVVAVLALGAFAVWRTRDAGALELRDPSAQLRLEVARVALSRVPLHPVFGHGMDAVHLHWNEWGFPGHDMLHAHSTPLQLAFDRGIPALAFWLWLVVAFWLTITRAEKLFRETDDALAHGLVLGAAGALAGFFLSSLVNYNFGDSEVAIIIWWLMGTVTKISSTLKPPTAKL